MVVAARLLDLSYVFARVCLLPLATVVYLSLIVRIGRPYLSIIRQSFFYLSYSIRIIIGVRINTSMTIRLRIVVSLYRC